MIQEKIIKHKIYISIISMMIFRLL